MKNRSRIRVTAFLLSLLLILTALLPREAVRADDPRDRDKDGLITFTELSDEDRNAVRRGYSPGGSFGYEMIFMMDDPYIMDLSDGHSLTVPYYALMARRAICYYRRSEVRNDERLYPHDTTRWFVTDEWEEDGEWYAAVNCTARRSRLTTPETIRYDGHTLRVVTLDLSNPDVRELTVTDNIETIRRCQCPRLQNLIGGRGVESIGKKAFMNAVSLVNFPYLPMLGGIGEFAFLGCLNLTRVLLPASIRYISWDAFGWYDVVLGNYDPDAPRESWWADFREEDPYYGSAGIFYELEKRKGVTLYAAKGTDTWKTLEEVYGAGDKKCAHVAFAEKTAYPGRLPDIDIDKEIDEEVERWLPKGLTVEDIDWGETETAEVPQEEKAIESALTDRQKTVVRWLEKLLLLQEIDEDLFLTLIGATVGVNPIPKDFTAKHMKDPEYATLEAEYMSASLVYYKAYKARRNNREADAKVIEKELFRQRYNLTLYVTTDFSYYKMAAENVTKRLGVSLPDSVKAGAFIMTTASHLNRLLDYVNKGDTWPEAAAKTFETTVYLTAAGEAVAANPVLLLYEGAIYLLFGTSDAADAASIVTTGTHTVELISDFSLTPFIEAWYTASNYPDNKKWDIFYTVWSERMNQTLRDLFNTQERRYGQTVTNFAYIIDMLSDSALQVEIFEGYIQQWNEGTLFSYFLQDVYNVTIKDSRIGALVEDAVLNNWFTQTMLDWTESYYSRTPSVLNDR